MSRSRPRVAVLYNAPVLAPDHPDSASERGVVSVARTVSDILRRSGFKAWPMPARPPLRRLLRALSNRKPDVVFQLAEGFAGSSRGESLLSSFLELLNLPYTGCPPEAQSLARLKSRTKWLLRGAGLPTAPFRLLAPGEPFDPEEFLDPDLSYPALIKLDDEDASLGIDQRSVVRDALEARSQIDALRVRFPASPILIEQYLPGPEFNVAVLAVPNPQPLPVAQVLHNPPAGAWPILTYDAKWTSGSPDDLASPVLCPAPIDPDLRDRLHSLALSAFRVSGCRDYARVDFRLDPLNHPMILEINPNPDLDPSAGLARALRASGQSYDDLIVSLTHQALLRGPRHA